MAQYRGRGTGSRNLQRAIAKEQASLGRKASKYGKAKKTGSGLGGLLGSTLAPLAGVALAPLTGGLSAALLSSGALMGAVGGGLGSLAGSKIGGATSGVSQDDLYKGSFAANTRGQIAEDIAGDEFSDALMNTATGAMSGYKAAGKTFGGPEASSKLGKFSQGVADGNIWDATKEYAKTTINEYLPIDASNTEVPGSVDETFQSKVPLGPQNQITPPVDYISASPGGPVAPSVSPVPPGIPPVSTDPTNLLQTQTQAFSPITNQGGSPMIPIEHMNEYAQDWVTMPDGRYYSAELDEYVNP